MVIHTAFVRYHNILCDRLVEEGLQDDDLIYNIARKIIGAILQNVLYGQWLPNVIGQELMDNMGLTVGSNAYQYDPNVDASIFNSFAAAAFRYGHSLVQGTIDEIDQTFRKTNSTDLKDTFFNPERTFSQMSNIARSLSLYRCKESDGLMVDDLKVFLFKTNTSTGMDLGALNVQRGRDHGLPGYVSFRNWAGLSVPNTFSDLADHTTDYQEKLAQLFDDVHDIGLFVGGLTETKVEDAHIGPTFAAILAEQFRRLKYCDRYYFENPGNEGFSSDQLANIKEVSLARILCQVFGLDVIQHNVFILPGVEDLEKCGTFADIDITKFIPSANTT